MNFPLGPEDVTIGAGHGGRGLQVRCPCGTVNWQYLATSEATWRCRNCQQVFTYDFPSLAGKVQALQKENAAAPAGSPAS